MKIRSEKFIFSVMITLLLAFVGVVQLWPQTVASLAPIFNQQFFDISTGVGIPCSGCLLYTYQTGTTTPLATYTDSTGATANSNPIILNAGGYNSTGAGNAGIWIKGTTCYDVALKTSDGVTIYTQTNVCPLQGPTGASGSTGANGPTGATGIAGTTTAVANTTAVTVNANSTGPQVLQSLSLPAGLLNHLTVPYGLYESGILTIGAAQTPTLTFTANLCTISGCGSGTVIPLATLTTGATQAQSNIPWNLSLTLGTTATGITGTVIGHGRPGFSIPLGALGGIATPYLDTNTAASSTIDLTAALFIQFTVTTSVGSTLNSFTGQIASLEPGSTAGSTGPTGAAGSVGSTGAIGPTGPASVAIPISNTTAVTANSNVTTSQLLQQISTTAGYLNIASGSGGTFTYNSSGVIITASTQTPTVIISLHGCAVSNCASGIDRTLVSITTAALASNTTYVWNSRLFIGVTVTGASGTLLVHGNLNTTTSAGTNPLGYSDTNTSSSGAIDLTGIVYLQLEVTFSTNQLVSNSCKSDHVALSQS